MPEINIALDLFGLIIMLIIFSSCIGERVKNDIRSNGFLFLMAAIMISLVGDVISYIGEGKIALATLSIVGNTVAVCSAYIAIFIFIVYIRKNLYGRSRAMDALVSIFAFLCLITIGLMVANAFYGFAFTVDSGGHYVHSETYLAMLLYLEFPVMSFITIVLMTLFVKNVNAKIKAIYISYTVFPIAGVIVDYLVHGWSLTYKGLVVGTVIIYTSIYLQRRRLIEAQRMSLMMSQMNPHFMYNTLNTVASLCETSPKSAKNLIIDFSTYLRRNMDTLTTTELIPFDQELAHVECYLKIEKARFMDRINVVYSINCKNFRLPALTLQPIVENAVKHGITKKVQGGTIKISTFETDKLYVIEVIDDGAGFDTEAKTDGGRTHIGISNVRARLKDACRGSLTVKSKIGVGTRATIEIPKKKGTIK